MNLFERIQPAAPAGFDYSGLEPELVTKLREAERGIRAEKENVIASAARTGQAILSVRDDLEHGRFLAWLDANGLSKSTAYRFMDVAQRLGHELPTVGSLPLTVVAQLAAPSTPEPVRADVVSRLKAGEVIPPEKVLSTVRDAREAEREARQLAKMSPAERKAAETKAKRSRVSRERRAVEADQEIESRRAEDAERDAAAIEAADMLRSCL